MRDLVANKQAGDHIVFACKFGKYGILGRALISTHHHPRSAVSGHGSQTDAINDKNEVDNKDECTLFFL